jgi:hypothetical protein
MIPDKFIYAVNIIKEMDDYYPETYKPKGLYFCDSLDDAIHKSKSRYVDGKIYKYKLDSTATQIKEIEWIKAQN